MIEPRVGPDTMTASASTRAVVSDAVTLAEVLDLYAVATRGQG